MDIFDTFSRSSQKFISVAKDYILPSKFNSVHNFLGSNINISFLQRPLFPYYFHYGHFLTSSTIIPCHKISQRKDHSPPFSFPKTARKKKGEKKSRRRLRSDVIDRGASHSKAIPEWRFLSLCSFRSFQLRNQHGDAY